MNTTMNYLHTAVHMHCTLQEYGCYNYVNYMLTIIYSCHQ